jgi:hypothetical protein
MIFDGIYKGDQVDVFAMGVILYFIVIADMPFK